ncbi:MAG TPA: ABC transporter ATP-binding protein [Candidatus Lachnoclostridium avicola]|nr:ABC transporter ATP-binding protein [Candidatus Lachnoclostridium avicola]
MTPLLEVSGVSHSYHTMEGETKALSHITFSIFNGEFVAVVGPSGCGKTTLLTLLDGLAAPEAGTILVNGRPVSEARQHIGYMFQRDRLLEWRTILANVSLGLEIQKRMTSQAREELISMLDAYGLGEFAGSRPSELSGGMRQRAALIRTLALKPDLLLLDEPFSALDYQTRLTVCDDISSIIRKNGKTAVLVTHDLSEAISAADRILVLSSRPGTIKAEIPLDFSGETSPIRRRNMPEFSAYFNLVWKELKI